MSILKDIRQTLAENPGVQTVKELRVDPRSEDRQQRFIFFLIPTPAAEGRPLGEILAGLDFGGHQPVNQNNFIRQAGWMGLNFREQIGTRKHQPDETTWFADDYEAPPMQLPLEPPEAVILPLWRMIHLRLYDTSAEVEIGYLCAKAFYENE